MIGVSEEAEIADAVLAAIGRDACMAAPLECCGALIGRFENGATRVSAHEALRNRAGDAALRYAIDADDVLRVQRRWEHHGADVVGFYHSHPSAAAVPSLRDAELAVPGYLYVIIGVAGQTRIRGWRADRPGAPLREVRLRRTGG